MNIKTYNFDSCYSTYMIDNNNTTGITSSPYYIQFPLSHPIRNIKRIVLLSIEIPILFNNIRGNTNNYYSLNYLSFNYVYNSVTYTYTTNITESFYNNISSLLTVMNNIILADATLTSRNIQVSFSYNSAQKIVITTNTATFTMNNAPISGPYNRTAYPFMNLILGFNGLSESTSNGTLTAPNRYNLNIDNYLNMQILNFGNNQNVNNINCSFKIPLNCTNGTIYYTFANTSYEQYIDNTDDNLILDKLNVRIVDRFNSNLNPNGGDFSFSLAIINKNV